MAYEYYAQYEAACQYGLLFDTLEEAECFFYSELLALSEEDLYSSQEYV